MVTNTSDIVVGDWVLITSHTSDWRDKIGVIRKLYGSGNYGISLQDTESSVVRKFSRGGFSKRSENTSHNDQTDRIEELERRIEDLQLRAPAETRLVQSSSNQLRGQSRPGGNTSRPPPPMHQAPTVTPVHSRETTSNQSQRVVASQSNMRLDESISSQSRSGGQRHGFHENTSRQSRTLLVSVTNVLYHESCSVQSKKRDNWR